MRSPLDVTLLFLLLPLLLATAGGQTAAGGSGKAGRSLLLVANQGDESLSLVNPETGVAVGKIKTKGTRAHEVTASADGRLAYLPIYGNSGVGRPGTDGGDVEIADLDQQSIVGSIGLGPVRPHWVKFGPGGLLYVSAEGEQAIDVVDAGSQKKVGAIPTGAKESHMVVISPDGSRAYTANVGAGSVSAVDVAARKLIKVIAVAETVQRISMTVDGKFVFTSDQKTPRLAVIDTATNEVAQWVALSGVGYGSAPTQDGKWLLVTMPEASGVAVIDLAQMKQVKTVTVPAHPVEILMRPDVAYVSCMGAGKVVAVDLAGWKVAKEIATGPGADGLAWAERK